MEYPFPPLVSASLDLSVRSPLPDVAQKVFDVAHNLNVWDRDFYASLGLVLEIICVRRGISTKCICGIFAFTQVRRLEILDIDGNA
ncbi:hypothetical protein TNCT_423271 [Trichonephila clavata]|uniref:Uncharacterized protein n=1 Tax=Trichonephila clavata TaxID=2740835 RepID=A0A8X6K9K6_TRICU|nr:hypothetical protein TNCT_423271 [Trichonephila clavata]